MKNKFFEKIDANIKKEIEKLKEYVKENIVTEIEAIDITTADEKLLERKDYLETSFHYLNEVLRTWGTIRTSLMHWDAFLSYVK